LAETDRLQQAVGGWDEARNAAGSRIDWRFTTADARIEPWHPYLVTTPA
jgi:hypothetical protein